MAYLCFYSAEGRGWGEGGRRLNSIYSSVVFREEREIEFTGDAAGRRAGEPGGLWGQVGEVGPGQAFPPQAALPGLGHPQRRPREASPAPLPGVAQLVGPCGSRSSPGMGVGACVQAACASGHTYWSKKVGHPCGQVALGAHRALPPSEAAGQSFGWCHPS